MKAFEDAATAGRRYAIGKVSGRNILEEIIFEAMTENPFKSAKSRTAFIDGVSRYINEASERRNRRMNER